MRLFPGTSFFFTFLTLFDLRPGAGENRVRLSSGRAARLRERHAGQRPPGIAGMRAVRRGHDRPRVRCAVPTEK